MRSHTFRLLMIVGLLLTGAVALGYRVFQTDGDLKAAERAADQRDFAAARQHLEAYLSRHPNDAETRLHAARIARRGEFYAAAAQHLREYRISGRQELADREDSLIRAQLGDLAQIRVLAQRYLGLNDSESSEVAPVAEAVAIGTLNALDPQLGAATVLDASAQPHLKRARDAVERWLAARPGSADQVAGRVWRGRLRYLGGDHAGAVADLRQALARDTESYPARLHLALVLAQTTPAEALEHLTLLHARTPHEPVVRLGLASVYHLSGRLPEAAKVLDEVLAEDPKHLVAMILRAQVALDDGHPADAERLMLQLQANAPNIPQCYQILSLCMRLTGQIERMKAYEDRFRELEARKKSPSP